MLKKIEIILNKENPRYPAIDADQIHIPFRGNVGLRISNYDFSCKVKMKFLDTGEISSCHHDIIEGNIEYPNAIWGVKEKTYDWVYFELTEPSECSEEVTFSLEILPFRKGKVVSRHHDI